MTGGPTFLPRAASASTEVNSRQGSSELVGEEGGTTAEGEGVPGAEV